MDAVVNAVILGASLVVGKNKRRGFGNNRFVE